MAVRKFNALGGSRLPAALVLCAAVFGHRSFALPFETINPGSPPPPPASFPERGTSEDEKAWLKNYILHNPSSSLANHILAKSHPDLLLDLEKSESENFPSPPEPLLREAEGGDPEACFALGMTLEDQAEALVWLKRASESGFSPADFALGNCYTFGRGTKSDPVKAMEYFLRASDSGDSTAMNSVGDAYEHGRGVGQDYEKAAGWYEKSAAAGNAMGQNNLARCYSAGRGVEKDPNKAERLYRKAASGGLDWAWANLAKLAKENAEGVGDIFRAYECTREAAVRGYAPSCYEMGVLFQFGSPATVPDIHTAIKWYMNAAVYGDLPALRSLGWIYETGNVSVEDAGTVEPDPEKALTCYRLAAEGGDPNSQYYLGLMYLYGKRVKKDERRGFEWLEKSANQGFREAMLEIAECYSEGRGVEKSGEKSDSWKRRASTEAVQPKR